MSQPTEGPLWHQGRVGQSVDYIRNLNPQQQRNLQMLLDMNEQQAQNLQKLLNKQPLRQRLHAAVAGASNRVQMVYQQTTERLSEAAQSLASQANQYRQAAVDRVNQFGQDVSNRANQVGQQVAGTYEAGRQAVVDGAQRGQAAVGQAWQQGTARATAAKDAVVQGAQNVAGRVAEGGRQAVETGQRMAGNTSRWFQTQVSRVQLAAASAQASFSATRQDPNVPPVSPKELSELSQMYTRALSAPNREDRIAALKTILETEQSHMDNDTAQRAALGGVAPAGQVLTSGQQNQGAQQSDPGAQTNVNLNKGTKGTDIQR